MAAKATTKRGLLPGYFENLQQKESKERYLEKLKSIEGQDPYEIPRKEWINSCLKFQIIPASAISETSYLSHNFMYTLFYKISRGDFLF